MSANPDGPPESEVRDLLPDGAIAERPKQVVYAVALLWVAILLSIPSSIYQYQKGATEGPAWFALVFLSPMYVGAVCVNIFIARGHNWARILLVVAMSISVSSFIGVIGFTKEYLQYPIAQLALDGLVTVMELIALYFLFSRPGALWFQRRKIQPPSEAPVKTAQGAVTTSPPSGRISGPALRVGGLAFAAGFLGGPLIAPESNLSPLLGLWTGAVGALVGAIWGAMSSAKDIKEHDVGAIFVRLAGAWVLTLLLTLFMMDWGTFVLPLIAIQGLIVVASASFLYRSETRTKLSEPVRRCRPIVIATLTLIMLMSVFPPVTRPSWVPEWQRNSADFAAPLPKFAFILDERFGRRLFAVDQHALFAEWVMLAILGLGVSLVVIGRRIREGSDMAGHITQVGALDPELRTSPILDDGVVAVPADAKLEGGVCYFNDIAYPTGRNVRSGDELLRCDRRGVWVRRGAMPSD